MQLQRDSPNIHLQYIIISFSAVDLITGNTVTISATVFDDNIQNVRFQILNPNGSTTNFQSGTQTSTLGDLTTWTFEVSTLQKGNYAFRIEMRDEAGNIVTFPDTSLAVERRIQTDLDGHKDGGGGGGGGNGDFIEFLVIDTLSELVDVARDNIVSFVCLFLCSSLKSKAYTHCSSYRIKQFVTSKVEIWLQSLFALAFTIVLGV